MGAIQSIVSEKKRLQNNAIKKNFKPQGTSQDTSPPETETSEMGDACFLSETPYRSLL